jgi:hypothetical protein
MRRLSPGPHHTTEASIGGAHKLDARGDKVLPQLQRSGLHLSTELDTLHEKVRCGEHCPVDGHKLHPAHARLVPLWRRIDVVASEDVTHCNLIDGIAQVRQRPLDTAVTSGGIFLSHPHHE